MSEMPEPAAEAAWAPWLDPRGTPFDPDDGEAYAAWRARKLAAAPAAVEDLVVPLADPSAPGAAEREALHHCLARANMAVYRAPPDTDGRAAVHGVGAAFGLHRLDPNMLSDSDGLTPLAVASEGTRSRYIPYTDKPIRWHTDGYYNTPERQIRGLILHCVRPAGSGGENALRDPEMAYIRLRDRAPALARALMRPRAMTIPGNDDPEADDRPDRAGPVLAVDPHSRRLHMRYTARTRNVIWDPDPAVQEAAAALRELLDESADRFVHRLAPGEGLICNNVLHTRERFTDSGPGRLVLRARYYDRCAGT